MANEDFVFRYGGFMPIQEPNFELTTGDVCLNYYVKKTFVNRVKYWLFCLFFPFKVTKWEINK